MKSRVHPVRYWVAGRTWPGMGGAERAARGMSDGELDPFGGHPLKDARRP